MLPVPDSVTGAVNGVNVTQLQADVQRLLATAVVKTGDQRIFGRLTMDGWTVSDWAASQLPNGDLSLTSSSATGYLATPGVTRPTSAEVTCIPVPLASPCGPWGPVGSPWDAGQSQNLTQVFDVCRVPETASVVSMQWRPTVYSDGIAFQARDAAGKVLVTWSLGTLCPITSPAYNGAGLRTAYPVPRFNRLS